MSKTRRDLVDRALENLGVLAAGQSPSAEDVAGVDAFVETTVADLIARDIYYVADYEEVDESIFDDLALCLANSCRHKFGLSGNPEIPAAARGAEDKLRIKSAQGPTYSIAKTVYY